MRFIQKWSYASAKKLTDVTGGNHRKRNEIYYGYQILYGVLFDSVVFITIAYALGILIPTLTILAFFAAIRMTAGGYHMTDSTRCLITSSIMFLGLGYILSRFYQFISLFWLVGLSGMVLFVLIFSVIKYAPKDTTYKPITKPNQIRALKIISIILALLLSSLQVYLILHGLNYLAFALCLGVSMATFLITPGGYKFFDFISKICK